MRYLVEQPDVPVTIPFLRSLLELKQPLHLINLLLHLQQPPQRQLLLAHLLPLAQDRVHLLTHVLELVLDPSDFCSDGEHRAADGLE